MVVIKTTNDFFFLIRNAIYMAEGPRVTNKYVFIRINYNIYALTYTHINILY